MKLSQHEYELIDKTGYSYCSNLNESQKVSCERFMLRPEILPKRTSFFLKSFSVIRNLIKYQLAFIVKPYKFSNS